MKIYWVTVDKHGEEMARREYVGDALPSPAGQAFGNGAIGYSELGYDYARAEALDWLAQKAPGAGEGP